MAIPVEDRQQIPVSESGKEDKAVNVICKGSLWTVYSSGGSLSLVEYGSHFTYRNIILGADFFSLSRALDSNNNENPDIFWLWVVDSSKVLNLYEVEPFSDEYPDVNLLSQPDSNIVASIATIIEGYPARLYNLYATDPVSAKLLFMDSVTHTSLKEVELDWDSGYVQDIFVLQNEPASNIQVVYSSDANNFFEAYELNPPEVQAEALLNPMDGTVVVSWSGSDEDASYILERASSADFSNTSEIYFGTDEEFYDTVPQTGTYYYRAKLIYPDYGVESDWSATCTLDTTVLTPVSGLVVTQIETYPEGDVAVTWDSAFEGAEYILERSDVSDFSRRKIVYKGSFSMYTDHVGETKRYYYRVKALTTEF